MLYDTQEKPQMEHQQKNEMVYKDIEREKLAV